MVEDPRVGTVIGGCRILELVGRGGMGVVYLADQLRLGRRVALKLIAPELSADPAFRARFQKEAQLAASLDHPNVIPIYEAGGDDELYIVMRYVEGRDVKPANVLVARQDGEAHAYLTDFGIAKAAESSSSATKTGQWSGSLSYVSPEQIGGQAGDAPSDAYSLGCVLFEALTGSPPYDRASDAARMWGHVNDEIPRVTDLVGELPPAFDLVVAKALAKAPEQRFATCSALGRAAVAVAEGRDLDLGADDLPQADEGGDAPRRRPSGATPRTRNDPTVVVVARADEDPAADDATSDDATSDDADGHAHGARRLIGRVALAAAGILVLVVAAAVLTMLQGSSADSDSANVRTALVDSRAAVVATVNQAADARVVNAKQRTVQDIEDPKFREPSMAALSAEEALLTALGDLRGMGDRDLAKWKEILPRLERARARIRMTQPSVAALDLGGGQLLPPVTQIESATTILDKLIRRAGIKLKRWTARLRKKKSELGDELAVATGYAETMRGYLGRYSGLRGEMQSFVDRVNSSGASYAEVYEFLGTAREARQGLKQSIDALSGPERAQPAQGELSQVLTDSIQAIDDAIGGTATYQSDIEGEYGDYRETPGWQRFGTASDRISTAYDGARGRWETAMKDVIATIKHRDLPQRPDV